MEQLIFIVLLFQSAIVTKSLADEFKNSLQTPMLIIHIGIYTAIGIGAFLLLVTTIVLVVKKLRAQVS